MDRTDRRTETDGALERPERRPTGPRAVAQPPMTPMIDVVFQLLLFFLLGCHFVVSEGQLRAMLQQGGMEGLGVRIIPVGSVRWQHVVDAFNQASRAGCTSVALAEPDRRR